MFCSISKASFIPFSLSWRDRSVPHQRMFLFSTIWILRLSFLCVCVVETLHYWDQLNSVATKAIVCATLELSHKVNVSYTSSWLTGLDEYQVSNTGANFPSKAVKMENIKTIPAPVYWNPVTTAQGFLKDFTKLQIEEDCSCLHNFIQGITDNSFMLFDSNGILSEDMPKDAIMLWTDEYLNFAQKNVWGVKIWTKITKSCWLSLSTKQGRRLLYIHSILGICAAVYVCGGDGTCCAHVQPIC